MRPSRSSVSSGVEPSGPVWMSVNGTPQPALRADPGDQLIPRVARHILGDALVLEAHRVDDTGKVSGEDAFSLRPDLRFQGCAGHEGVDEVAPEGVGCTGEGGKACTLRTLGCLQLGDRHL